jgi:glutathione synthase/RimK-type ligase-like ATP-grasp enzyme
MSSFIIVVDNVKRWDLGLDELPVVAARDYLADPHWSQARRQRVLNLCRSYRYQSSGYYVSLLAEARGHRVMPSVATIQDFKSQSIIKSLAAELQEEIQRALAPLQSDKFTLSIYFARNMARRYDKISRDLYNLFQSPLLRVNFSRSGEKWQLQNISPIAWSDVPESHRPFVLEAARDFLRKRASPRPARAQGRYDMAILIDPADSTPPSNEGALRLFEKAAAALDIGTERITADDYGSIGEYDALFIRTTTAVNHYTYRFARRAQADGLVVIDDPRSILRCTNKVFLQELMTKHRIPAPPTRILHRDNIDEVLAALGLPCILKQPDSAFSKGVIKVDNEADYRARVDDLLEDSELLIVQGFIPTQFDWRIGVIDGEPLYACCYYMARGHWQIYNHAVRGRDNTGDADAVPIDSVPGPVLDAALKAARLMGDGLYGVDLKEYEKRAVIIEVNDNPSIDAGVEDAVIGQSLYNRIMQSFLRRLERRHQQR